MMLREDGTEVSYSRPGAEAGWSDGLRTSKLVRELLSGIFECQSRLYKVLKRLR